MYAGDEFPVTFHMDPSGIHQNMPQMVKDQPIQAWNGSRYDAIILFEIPVWIWIPHHQ